MNLKIYEINPNYITYLSAYAPHLFLNRKQNQKNERKFIGIILQVNGFKYFAPLSSFKEKHRKMKESVDFIKIRNYAVININNMFPVPTGEYTYVDIGKEKDVNYNALLQAEYRIIKASQNKIIKNANIVYKHKLIKGNETPLAKRYIKNQAPCYQTEYFSRMRSAGQGLGDWHIHKR